MGMLMHHTWLNEQKKQKPSAEKPVEKPVENNEPEAEPVKKTGGRRKNIK